MSTVEPLEHEIIERYLSTSGYRFMRDQDGDYFMIFAATDKRPELHFLLALEADKQVYVVRSNIPETFSMENEQRLLTLVNRWNREYRWPKAILGVNDERTVVRVWTEMHLPSSAGVHQGLIGDFTSTVIRSSDTFFTWLRDQLNLPSVEQLEALFREAS